MSSTHFPFDTCDVLLGKGGGGAVYLGRHHETKEYVAIKRCYTRRSNNEEHSLEHSVGAELFSQIHNCNSTPLLAHSFSQPFITNSNNNDNNNTYKSKKSKKNIINSNNRKIEWNREFFTRNATREATAMTNECVANRSNSNDLIKRQIDCEHEEQTVEQEESWEKEEEPELALTLPVHSFTRKPNWPFSELSQETESDNELTNKFGPPLLTESISSQKCISPSELTSQQICTQNEEDMREESNLQMQASRQAQCASYSVNNNINGDNKNNGNSSNNNNNTTNITDSHQKAGSLNRTINTFTPLMINTNNTLSKTTSNIYNKKNSKDYDYHHSHENSKQGMGTHYRTETKSGWRSLTMSPLLLSNSASSPHYKERTINSLNNEVCILHALPPHPHIVTFYGSYTSSRLVTFFAMELMHSDVSRELHHHNVQMMNEQTCVAIAFSVLEALEHLHRHNIAHRDVKPGNILLKHMTSKELTTSTSEIILSQVKRTEMEELKESIYHPYCILDKSKKTENMRSNKKADKTKRCKHNEEKLSTKEKYECEEKEKSQEEECELVKACLGDFSAAHFATNKNASAGSPAFDYNINNINSGYERWYNKFPEEHEPCSHHERVKLNVRGSLHYKSPEQLLGKAINNYTACDMWALGCTLFEMCTGAIAFGGDSEMSVQLEIFCQLKSSFQEYPNQDDTLAPLYHRFTLSELFVDLLQHLLVIDPCKRWSASEALAHPIFDTLRATQRAKESMLQNTSRESESCELSKETATNSSFCSATDSVPVVFPLHLKYARDVNKYEHMWRFRPIATTPPSSPLTFSQQPLTLRSRLTQSITEQEINTLEQSEEEQESWENQNQQVQKHEEYQNNKHCMTAQDHPSQQWEPEEEQSEMSLSRANIVRSTTTNQLSHVELHNKSHVLMPAKVLSLTDDAEVNNSVYPTNNNNNSNDNNNDNNKETSKEIECLEEEREDENQMSVLENDMSAMHNNNECLEPNMSSFLSDAQSQH